MKRPQSKRWDLADDWDAVFGVSFLEEDEDDFMGQWSDDLY
jgi:hypothetical protein